MPWGLNTQPVHRLSTAYHKYLSPIIYRRLMFPAYIFRTTIIFKKSTFLIILTVLQRRSMGNTKIIIGGFMRTAVFICTHMCIAIYPQKISWTSMLSDRWIVCVQNVPYFENTFCPHSVNVDSVDECLIQVKSSFLLYWHSAWFPRKSAFPSRFCDEHSWPSCDPSY